MSKSASERGRLGGLVTAARYGREHYQQMGRAGGRTTVERYGREHLEEIAIARGERLLEIRGVAWFAEMGRRSAAARAARKAGGAS